VNQDFLGSLKHLAGSTRLSPARLSPAKFGSAVATLRHRERQVPSLRREKKSGVVAAACYASRFPHWPTRPVLRRNHRDTDAFSSDVDRDGPALEHRFISLELSIPYLTPCGKNK